MQEKDAVDMPMSAFCISPGALLHDGFLQEHVRLREMLRVRIHQKRQLKYTKLTTRARMARTWVPF